MKIEKEHESCIELAKLLNDTLSVFIKLNKDNLNENNFGQIIVAGSIFYCIKLIENVSKIATNKDIDASQEFIQDCKKLFNEQIKIILK